MVADRGWVLLELHRDTQTLEDVFRNLTIGDERQNRRLGPAKGEEPEEEEDDDEDEDEEDEDEDES
jgi:ABC-2 type transport system ATP-binding protein